MLDFLCNRKSRRTDVTRLTHLLYFRITSVLVSRFLLDLQESNLRQIELSSNRHTDQLSVDFRSGPGALGTFIIRDPLEGVEDICDGKESDPFDDAWAEESSASSASEGSIPPQWDRNKEPP